MPNDIESRVKILEDIIRSLRASATIPKDIDAAFRTRLNSDNAFSTSAKGATTENQAVNEAGSGTYSVLGPPDGFYKTTLKSGTVIYVPGYTS